MAELDSLPATLIGEASCYACYGLSMYEIFKTAMLVRQARVADPSANVSPTALLALAKCYNCYGATNGQLFELALLQIIADAS